MTELDQSFAKTLGIIAELKPRKMLLLSPVTYQKLEAAKPDCEILLLDLESTPMESLAKRLDTLIQEVDLVLVTDEIETLDPKTARQVIGLLRNTLNAQILALFSSAAPLGFSDMIGLGFKRETDRLNTTSDTTNPTLYTYDIASYNKKREWNNSRFWANPENFNKFRW